MRYNWQKLEKEYILGDYKSINLFLKEKGISRTGAVNKATKGWKEKKAIKEQQKSNKTIEKVIEKEATKEASEIVKVSGVAEDLLLKINEAIKDLDKIVSKKISKTKVVSYDNKIQKPSKEVITENEEYEVITSLIDRNGLKQLTSALKDLNEIIGDKDDNKNKKKKVIVVNDL